MVNAKPTSASLPEYEYRKSPTYNLLRKFNNPSSILTLCSSSFELVKIKQAGYLVSLSEKASKRTYLLERVAGVAEPQCFVPPNIETDFHPTFTVFAVYEVDLENFPSIIC